MKRIMAIYASFLKRKMQTCASARILIEDDCHDFATPKGLLFFRHASPAHAPFLVRRTHAPAAICLAVLSRMGYRSGNHYIVFQVI
jgi:hypothetical protein